MNELNPTSNQPQFSADELQRLIRQGDPPLTRREIRARERAEELGYLTRVGQRLVIADVAPQQAASSNVAEEPPSVTSADVLAGRVPAASGLTRRQLRELAAQHDSQQAEDAAEAPQEQVPPAQPAPPEPAQPETSPPPVTGATSRPVVHPPGRATGEYTGEFDKIRQAMADINAAPEQAPQGPARRSVFRASVPQELQEPVEHPETPAEQTDAADWTAVIDSPTVTDDLLPELEDPEPEAEPVPEPERQASTGSVPSPGDDKYNFPDWHTLTSIPTVSSAPQSPNSFTHASTQTGAKSTPVWLTVLQWLVIAAVAVVLGLLVWYAINRGLVGSGSEEAWGIMTPAYYLRT